ncbi:MAG: serine/threonine-protein kinase [Victivallales bacterium]|nr:serine/threonine-protein kinase [Victivallales bacterium]
MKKIFVDQVEFEVISKVADGGMGSVYKALQKGVHGFAKTVAIKTILENYAADSQFITDFISEAMLVANLVHENIVQIYQLGKYKKEYYFVLEFVDGISLYDFMQFHQRIRRQLPPELAVFIVSRVARGLAYAHTRRDRNGEPMNIVHCDVCPHNIMLNTEGVPKLTDFGIAKANIRKEKRSGLSGKLPFISPEQAEVGAAIDFRSDIYSLGIVLFYLLSGKFPRHVDLPLREMIDEIRGNQLNWSLLPEDLDADLLALLRRMLAQRPEDRFADTSELARSLEYHIYKDGYGPTIVSLAAYMKELLPGIFQPEAKRETMPHNLTDAGKTTLIAIDKTVRMT